MNNIAYQQADLACAKLYYRLHSSRMYEDTLLIPDAATKVSVNAQYTEARDAVDALTVTGAAEGIMKSHFSDFLDAAKQTMDGAFADPKSGLTTLYYAVERTMENDSRPDEEKAERLIKVLAQAGDIISAAGPDADACMVTDVIRHYSDDLSQYMPSLSPAGAAALQHALQKTVGLLEPLKGVSAAPVQDDESLTCAFTEEYYRSVLHNTLGVSLDELLSWYEEEIEKTRANVFSIASKLPISDSVRNMAEVNAVLNKYAGPAENPDAMFARMQTYLDRAQAAAHGYVWFPEEVCRLKGVPWPLRKSFPWGGYSDGDGRLRPITGTVFLNNYNFKAVTDGWMKMQSIHESYPGHHIQYVRNITDTLPETFKIGAKNIPLIEGTAHRSEHVFEFVFEEDPFYPLFVAYRRHHTAVRIKNDLMLRLFGRPISECVKLYMDELDFDHDTARGQVLAQQNMEGYFTCYYYGYKKLTGYEAQYGYDAKRFTEELFSCGNVSITNVEKYLALSAEEKQHYKTDFVSLLMDPEDIRRYKR